MPLLWRLYLIGHLFPHASSYLYNLDINSHPRQLYRTHLSPMTESGPLHEGKGHAPGLEPKVPTGEEVLAFPQRDDRPRPYYYTPPLWSVRNLWTILRTRNLPGEPHSGHKPDCCYDKRLIPKWSVLYDALVNRRFLFMDTPEKNFRNRRPFWGPKEDDVDARFAGYGYNPRCTCKIPAKFDWYDDTPYPLRRSSGKRIMLGYVRERFDMQNIEVLDLSSDPAHRSSAPPPHLFYGKDEGVLSEKEVHRLLNNRIHHKCLYFLEYPSPGVVWLRHWQPLFSPFLNFAVPAYNITYLLLVLGIFCLYMYLGAMLLLFGQSFPSLGWYSVRLWPSKSELCIMTDRMLRFVATQEQAM
ncbi:hypothetical protein BDW22DRAFT_1360920 [Trametopsis cervina]|nr:hypothetical protein BDW22DRAFT_1360920 [Trametopsis cervina]